MLLTVTCYNSDVTTFRLRFWLAVQDLKRRPLQDVASRAQEIWQEFLAEGAPSSINLDSHSYERTSQNLKDPGRYSYEDAQVGWPPLTGLSARTSAYIHA